MSGWRTISLHLCNHCRSMLPNFCQFRECHSVHELTMAHICHLTMHGVWALSPSSLWNTRLATKAWTKANNFDSFKTCKRNNICNTQPVSFVSFDIQEPLMLAASETNPPPAANGASLTSCYRTSDTAPAPNLLRQTPSLGSSSLMANVLCKVPTWRKKPIYTQQIKQLVMAPEKLKIKAAMAFQKETTSKSAKNGWDLEEKDWPSSSTTSPKRLDFTN